MSPLPENLEKVAEAGGWDARQAERATEFMKEASKIKEREWKAMTGTVGALQEFAAVGGLEGMFDRLSETWSLQVENALSPLTNEVTQLVAEALAPFMPMITETMNQITNYLTLGMGAIEAALTGNWDSWIEEQTIKFQKGMEGWDDDWKAFHTNVQKLLDDLEKNRASFQLDATSGASIVQDIETWGNDVNQWWYELWIGLSLIHI